MEQCVGEVQGHQLVSYIDEMYAIGWFVVDMAVLGESVVVVFRREE